MWPATYRRNASQLQRDSVVLPRVAGQPAIVSLYDTKTTKTNLLQAEKVLIAETTGINCLRFLCNKQKGSDSLVDTTAVQYRRLWKGIVQQLGLEEFHYMPYSLRRGGATCAHREGLSFDLLLTKGRWQNIATARTYVDQALQEFARVQIPSSSLPRICAAKKEFLAAGLGRVEGVERGRWV